jgi:dihydropteroate synthase
MHAKKLISQGADIIDLGAESTRPNASNIDPKNEWARLEPILTAILQEKSTMIIAPKISVDTRNPYVAQQALQLGVDIINDVSGLDDEKMRSLLKDHTCDIVLMHHLGIPANKTCLSLHEDFIASIYSFADERIKTLHDVGIKKERIIFDVGIGFGKTAEQSFVLIKEISYFKTLGVRLLVGHSRKSFLSSFTEKSFSERDLETMVVSNYLAHHEVDFLRLHDIENHSRAFKISRALID